VAVWDISTLIIHITLGCSIISVPGSADDAAEKTASTRRIPTSAAYINQLKDCSQLHDCVAA